MAYGIGRDVTFTYTSGPETLSVANFPEVFFVEERSAFETTPPGYLMKRRTPGILDFYGMVGQWFETSGSTPPTPGGSGVPSGSIGTLAFTLASGKTKTAKVIFTKLQMQSTSQEGSPPQRWQYAFAASAQNTTDTITTT